MTKKILSDEAIDTFENDLLNRKSFVENLSSSLLSWNDKKSLVIGLFGKWGSGKTSIINLLEKQLSSEKEKKSSKDKKKSPIVINFNPWGYSETEDLLEPFIRQIQATLKGPDKIKGFGKKLELYLNLIKLTPTKQSVLSFWSAITMVLSFVGISLPQLFPNLCKQIKEISKWISPITLIVSFIIILCNIVLSIIKVRNENLDESVSKIKKDIGNILEKENRKLIIIMDDIDRLSSQEIKQLFRIVRSNADFPNTIYLLSFDREIVEKSLDIQNRIDGRVS
ncbi:MAG: P-loop NTPase fold protein [Treponema sp.]|nr:P-loop NTPase fold protein [Treponema sp.]